MIAHKNNLKSILLSREVIVAFVLVGGLWVANTLTGTIGRPLDPLYRIVFAFAPGQAPPITGSVFGLSPFVVSALVFILWLVVYSYILAVFLGVGYKMLRTRVGQ